MHALAPCSLDSASLARRLRDLAGNERAVQVDFLLHLDEFDRRQEYLPLGFGSCGISCSGNCTCGKAPPAGASRR